MSESATLRSGQLAQLCGVSSDTLRHYERKGVLPAPRRLANGYREFPASALLRVRTVRAALALGFTLDELAEVLGERERGGAPCRRVRQMAAEKLAAGEARLADLERLLDSLRQLLAEWDSRLAATADGRRAGLLDVLVSHETVRPSTPRLPDR